MSKKIILASKSPRRHDILKEAGFDFEIITKETDESFLPGLSMAEIPIYIAQQKAYAVKENLCDDNLIIASDTIVTIDEKVLGKPTDANDAAKMLETLSGKWHQVVTGVCVLTTKTEETFSVTTHVLF